MIQKSTVKLITGLSFLLWIPLVCFWLFACAMLQHTICTLAYSTVPEHHDRSFERNPQKKISIRKSGFLLKILGLSARDVID